MAATKKTQEVIEIRPLEIERKTIKIVGTSPLIVHAWDEKAKREILEAQQGKKKGKQKSPKNPVADFINSMYWLTPKPAEMTMEAFNEAIANGARFGFPVTAIKQATISAAYRMGWIKNKMEARGVFFIDSDSNGLIEIQADAPVMREDMVKISMGTADIRYRGQFNNWSIDLVVNYNKNGSISFENIANMINAGGYCCGIGERRPERDGQYGMYEIGNA